MTMSLASPVQTAVLVHVREVPDLAQHGHGQLGAQHHVPHLTHGTGNLFEIQRSSASHYNESISS